jgi:hypothetical protein
LIIVAASRWSLLPTGRYLLLAAVALASMILATSVGRAGSIEVKKTGKLNGSGDAALMVFCPDRIIEQVLNQDFRVAKRAATAESKTVLSLTVTATQQALRPGISLGQVAPGNPEVAELIKAAGAVPPPIGDTGDRPDQAAVAREVMQRHLKQPSDSPLSHILSGEFGSPPPPCAPGEAGTRCVDPTPQPKPDQPGYTGDVADYLNRANANGLTNRQDDSVFDTVVVARASLFGSPDELTVVAVVHPGDDVNDAKKLVAEEIANAVLH